MLSCVRLMCRRRALLFVTACAGRRTGFFVLIDKRLPSVSPRKKTVVGCCVTFTVFLFCSTRVGEDFLCSVRELGEFETVVGDYENDGEKVI